MARTYSIKVLELMDDGYIEPKWLVEELLAWMSEAEVQDFYNTVLRNDEDEEETDNG